MKLHSPKLESEAVSTLFDTISLIGEDTIMLSTWVTQPGDWIRVVTASEDSDGDGVPDCIDDFIDSDTRETLILFDKDTGIPNDLILEDPSGIPLVGCYLADIVDRILFQCTALANDYAQYFGKFWAKHWVFVKCVARGLHPWKKAGIITKAEWFTIIRCVWNNGRPHNNGHGNNEDGVDVSNPGSGSGGPNGRTDESGEEDDEKKGGNDDD